jgi:Lon protease-like protein
MAFHTIPIFPLPSVVLFPNVFLPLHIFEARYRQMVADALAGDRTIGMTLLKPGYEEDYEGRPPVYPVGCSGVITHVERLSDGRFNIVLRGAEKFRILGEVDPGIAQLYRRALVDPLTDEISEANREQLAAGRQRLESYLAPLLDQSVRESLLPTTMSDADLVNALGQYLDFEPMERQALLELPHPLARCDAILDLLELKALQRKAAGEPGTVH